MNAKVLVVDDDPILTTSLKLKLDKAGFEVDDAADGREAIQKVEVSRPDVILADIMMPRMNGYELHDRLRKNPVTADIPFIFLTARTDISDQLEGLRMGADDYVCKPFKTGNLVDRMRRALERADKVRSFRVKADFSGNLSHMTWSDIVQIAELNYKSGELVLRDDKGGKIGVAFFAEGRLVNARVDGFEGEEAFYALMKEERGFFEFFGKNYDHARLIESSNASMLLKGSRMVDEYRYLRRALPDLNVSFKIEKRVTPEKLEQTTGPENLSKCLSLIEQGETARAILYSGHMSPPRAASILAGLLKEKNIDIARRAPPGIANVSTAPSSLLDEGLVKVLNIIERRRLTGLLQCGGRSVRQAIFSRKGRIVHAFHGKVTGKKALFRIFRERGGTLKFFRKQTAVLTTIEGTLPELLGEGQKEIRKLDEVRNDFLDKTVEIDPAGVQGIIKERSLPGLRKFISLVQQHGKISEIVDSSELTDGKTHDQLEYLIEIGLLKLKGKSRAPIQLITDSTADIPPETAASKNIIVAPLSIHFDETVYKDGVTVTPDSFYKLLLASPSFPRTSPPSFVEFHQLFRSLAAEKDMLGVFLSRKMSETYENAKAVKDENHDDYIKLRRNGNSASGQLKIEVIDSGLVSLGLGLLVLEAAEKIAQGWPIEKIASHVKALRGKVRTYFVVDSLEYLRRGGRIGKARALLGTLLRFKPILGVADGEVVPVTQVRGGKNAQQKVVQIVAKELEDPTIHLKMGIFHAEAPESAERLRDLLEMNFNCGNIIMSKIGPTVGTHCGPGTVGLSYLPVDDSE